MTLIGYDNLFCIDSKKQADNPDLNPKCDDYLHANVKCWNCNFEDWIDATIVYPQFTERGQFKQFMNQFKEAYVELNNFLTDHNTFTDSFAQDYPFKFSFDEMVGDVDKWVKSAIDHLPKTEPKPETKPKYALSINQSVDFFQLKNINWSLYDGTELNAIAAFDENDKVLPWESIGKAKYMEPDFEEKEYTGWSVYLHRKEGGVDNIADFKDKEEAGYFESFIQNNFFKTAELDNDDEIVLTEFVPLNVGDLTHIDLRSMLTTELFSGGFHVIGKSCNEPEAWNIDVLDDKGEYETCLIYEVKSDFENDVAYLRKAAKGELKPKTKTVNLTVSTTVPIDTDEEQLRISVDDAVKNSDNLTSKIVDHDVYNNGN